MKATITSPPPPPAEITLVMSERDARIITAFIGVVTTSEFKNQLKENMYQVEDILPANFNINADLNDDIGYRFYKEMSDVLDKLPQ